MTGKIKTQKKRSGAGLPLFLLILFLGGVGGVATWVGLAPPFGDGLTIPATDIEALRGGPPRGSGETAEAGGHGDAATTPADPHHGDGEAPAKKAEITGGVGDIAAAPGHPATEDIPEKPGDGHGDAQSGEKPAEPEPAKPAAEAPAPAPAAPPVVAKPRIAVERSSESLAPSPDPDLIQQSPLGPLPVVSRDGRKAWQVYGRPFDRSEKRPKIAIVVSQLGLSVPPTEAAIQGLPGAVTLSFAAYADNLEEWIRLARAAGHEVLLDVPMEPVNYPTFDPGPQALFTNLSTTENLNRLYWTLGRATGYVGVADFMGSRFTTSREHMVPVLDALKKRGLLFLDTRRAPRSVVPEIGPEVGIAWAANTRFIDEQASRRSIDTQLGELERAAKENGAAIGIGLHYPVTIERIAAWVKTLGEKGLVVAPVSAIVTGGTEG